MTESERIHVNVPVAIVTDQNIRVLLTFNDSRTSSTRPGPRVRKWKLAMSSSCSKSN